MNKFIFLILFCHYPVWLINKDVARLGFVSSIVEGLFLPKNQPPVNKIFVICFRSLLSYRVFTLISFLFLFFFFIPVAWSSLRVLGKDFVSKVKFIRTKHSDQ